MKNKFKILSIFAVIAIIFIGVDLKEVKAESYQISFKENELCIVEEEKCSFSYNTNAEEISNIEVHYIINGVDYTSDKETTVPGQGHVPKEYLTQTENTITVYEKNTSTNAETNRININLIAVHESKEVENLPDNDLKIYMSLNFTPIDAKVSIKKVTDKNILNKLGTNYVYHFQLLSGSKNIYDLNLEGAISGFMTPAGTKVKLEIPSEIRGKLNTTASHNEDLYFLSSSDLNLNDSLNINNPTAIENDYAILNDVGLDTADFYFYFKTDPFVNANSNGSQTIHNVPNTALNKAIIIIVAAIILVGVGSIIIYKVTKDKKQNVK